MTSGSYGSGQAGQPGQPQQPGQPNEPGGPQYGQPQYGGGPQYGQPQYGQPQYGQQPQYGGGPQYGQPQYGQQPQYGAEAQYGQPGQQQYGGYGPPSGSYGTGGGAKDRPGAVGIVLAVLGAIAGIIAFTATNWFDGGDAKFSDLHDGLTALDKAGMANGLSVQYFGWLAWTLLAVAAAAAIFANLPTPANVPLRIVGAVVAAAGIVLTFIAIKLISKSAGSGAPDGYGEYIKHAAKAPSLYLAVGAFLLILIGSLLGPRRA